MNQSSSSGPPVSSGRFWRRASVSGAALALLAGLAFLAGPRNAFGPEAPTPRVAPPADLTALEGWLAHSEAAYPDLLPEAAKGIVWNGAPGQRTPWSVVYVHGFTASRLETAPTADKVARAIGANLFYTRLTGHGRGPMAMGEARVQDWLADVQEAVTIGRLLGQRVLLIGCSTGATLASWQAMQPAGQADAYAFISPNFGPRNKRSEIINYPWGQQIALALEGEMRGQLAENPRENRAWTLRYATRALFPMMALIRHVRASDWSQFKTPVLMLYAEGDQTVDPAQTRDVFARIGSTQKTLEVVDYSHAQGQHVLAGDLMAPEATEPMAARIAQWTAGLNLSAAPATP
jgi:alpha-beta hydrolase superfamily lysophospholipase